ncbi:hypothetical protein [Bradyrhizobium elkanii]|uniref:hypothetical protein n=1 Tax=Bradyrhizobium elkanii TaxID=29448 RepID=UPI000841F326|nr:hypothetical protein [Bradyrhizobium elkanii]ODM79941.1 hypothetical protein A6452_24295 [Bradyrhizobium elkanii]
MSDLDQAWAIWRRLSGADRIKFGSRVRKLRQKERQARRDAMPVARTFADLGLSLTEANFGAGSIAARPRSG